jgi:uncharacterized protein
MKLAGKWALVTGASGGLGAEFALLLAQQGSNLILAARNVERLETVAADLRGRFGILAHVQKSDLSEDGAAEGLIKEIKGRGIRLDVLINNAGQGLHGDFVDQSTEAVSRMIQLNISSLTSLTRAVAADMVDRGSGHILLVASLTAFMPAPTYAAYAATKAYVRHFGEALHVELKPRNVVVTVLSPGLMDTGFLDAAGQRPSRSMKSTMTSPRKAAETGLDALFTGQQSVVAGRMNKAVAIASRLIPRGAQARIMANALNA